MITQKDWERIKTFATTPHRESYVGPWGWESADCFPEVSDVLEFIAKEIGIKEHIGAPNGKL
jgi:hypothetical protein